LPDVDLEVARAALNQGDFAGALAAYGIVLPPTQPAANQEEAARIAGEMGYPVVLKLDSEDISHKSDAGGVRLNLSDAPAVEGAFEQIIAAAKDARPDASIQGVLVQKMMTGGQELIVGVRRDPQFGPLALVGSGGVEVELLRDVATAIAPLSHNQAERLLDKTRAGLRLKGWRGLAPADSKAVVAAMRRVAQIACDFPEIEELEINPLYVLPEGEGAFALDVRGRLSE
jgi:acetyltransferase